MIDRKEIKKIVLKGGLSWSDIAPSESSFDYNSEKQRSSDEDETARREAASRKEAEANEEIEAKRKSDAKKKELVQESKSNKVKSSDIPLAQISPKRKESYNFLDWTADSYKTLILKKNQSQIGASNGYIKHFLAPAKLVGETVYENRNNPEFINYVKTVDELSKKESTVTPELKSILNNRSLTDTQRRENYEKQLRSERATRDRGLLEPGGIGQFVGETIKRGVQYLSDIRKLGGDIYQLFDNDQTILPTTQADILADRAREYEEAEEAISLAKNGEYGKLAMKYNPYSNAFRSANRFGNDYALGVTATAGLGIASTGARGAMAIKDVAGAALTNVAAGAAAYKTSKYVNGNNGYRDILDIEVPDEMRDAHTKYWDVVSEWSKLGGDYSIPDIKEIVNGKPIGDKWFKESNDKIAKEYAEKLEDVSRDRADMAHLKFMGINIDQPTERAIKEAEEQGTWFNTIGNVGMSISEAGAQASIAGLSMAVSMAASKMARVGKYSPIAISAIANIATSLPNAYVSRMMRENEYATSLDQNFNQKQDAYLKSIGKPSISEMNDADLISSVSDGRQKDLWAKELMQTGKLSTDSRADLELALRTGMVKTTNSSISESIKKANLGTDESARQYMSMIYSDMADNAITALPFYFKGVSNFKAGGSAISKAFGHAAEDYTNYLYKSKAGMFLNNTKTGKALSIAGQMAGRYAGNIASELFLEENPQYVIDQKYINNELRDNPNAVSVLKDTYASALTGFQGLLGVSGDHRYDNKDSDIHKGLVDNAIATVWSTLIQGSAANIITTAGQTRAAMIDNYAKNFVNGVVVNQMKMSNREAKTDVYVKAMSNDKMDAVIDNLKALRENLPEGITEEEIDNEVKLAKKTIAVANSKGVKAYANASAGFGSSDHKLLTALIVDHIDSRDAAIAFSNENESKFMDVVDSEIKDSPIYKSLIEYNPEMSDLAIREAYITAAKLEAIRHSFRNTNTENDNRSSRINKYLSNEEEKLEARIAALTGMNESEVDKLPSTESSEILSLYKSAVARAGARYDEVMADVLSMGDNSAEYLSYVDKKLEDYRSSRKSEEAFDEKIETAVDIAREEASNAAITKNDQIIDEPVVFNKDTDEISDEENAAIDAAIVDFQNKTGVISQSIVEISDETESVLSDIESNRPVINERLQSASKELYGRYKAISAMMKSTSRKNTMSQLQNALDAISEDIERLESMISKQAESGEFAIEKTEEDKRTLRKIKTDLLRRRSEKKQQEDAPKEEQVKKDKNTENQTQEEFNKEEDGDITSLIEEANSIIAKGAKATGNEQTGGTREDSSNRQADRGDTGITKDEPDKEEDNNVDQGEDTFEDSNSKINKDAANSVSESGVIEEILEDEDSSLFYEIEDEFPGATESAKEDQKRDKLSRTLFSADKATHEFLSKPDALEDAEVIITVSRIPDANVPKNRRDRSDVNPYNKPFSINDESTWNEAWIEVEIKSKKYGNFKLNVSLPDQAQFRSFKTLPGGKIVPKFSQDEIDALIVFRNNIISEYKKVVAGAGKKKLISIGGIARGKAKIALNRLNGMAVQRGLHKIAGMIDGFTGNNFEIINNDTLKLAYARGSKGIYDIIGLYGTYGYTHDQNSGNMFIVKQDPITGENRNIKINKKRFRDDESMIDLIYRLAVEMGASMQQITINKEGRIELVTPGAIAELGITANSLLNKIVTFGSKTIVSPSERSRFKYLVDKQFYIDGTTLHYGDNAIDISNSSMISPEQKEDIISFIRENLHWTISKEDLWNPTGNDNLVRNLFPQLGDYFKNNNKKSVKFADGFTINEADLDLTWAAWIVKNEKLVSDTGDGVFDAPYTYLNDVRAVDVVKSTNVLSDTKTPDKTSENKPESTSTEEATANNDKPAKKKSLFNLKSSKKINIGGKPRPMSDGEFAKIQEDEIAWIKSRLTNPEIVDHVIDVAGDKAMGLTTSSSIILYNGAEAGTAYHEAFHFVSLLLSNRNRRMAMYEQVRTSVDGMKDATNSEIEEYLAENFREWMMTNRSKQKASMVKSLFRRMKDFVSSTRNLTKSDIDRIYRNIDLGIYKSSRANSRSKKEFQMNYERGAARLLRDKKFKYIDSVDLQYSVVDGLTCYLFDIFNVGSINDVGLLDIDELKPYIDGAIEELTDAGADPKIIGIYNDIKDNFESEFKPMIEAKLATFGIINSGIEDQDEDSSILGDEIRRYYKADYEISKRDNIPFEIKFFLSTIFKFKRNEDGSLESVENSQTLMKEFVDSNIAWKKLIDELKDELSPESMLARIDLLAANSTDPFYVSLKNKIDEFYSGDIDFSTKLWSSMYSHRHQFVNFAYNANQSAEDKSNLNKIIESKLGDARSIMPKIWGENAVNGGLLFSNTEDGYVFNAESAKSILDRFTLLSRSANRLLSQKISLTDTQLADMLSELSSLLNAIGINIDNRVLESFIDSNIKNEPKTRSIPLLITRVDSTFPSIIFTNIISGLINNDGKLIVNKREKSDLKTIYQSQKSIMKLAEANARVHTTPTEATSTGADGSTVYEIALRNYILDMFTKLKKGSEILRKMLGVVSNKNSIVLNQINDGLSSGVKVKTFLKMYQELSGDKGRDYFNISKAEDYIMKMTAILDGMMVSPAMADKKSYYMFDGVNMPDFISNPISYSEKTGRMSIPSNVLNIFNGYFKDEYESIKSGWNDYVAVKGDKKLLEEVYHYGGVDWRGGSKYATKGKWNSGLGNGLHFRHFDIVRISTPEGSYDLNLNDVMEEFISNLGKEEGMNAFFTFMDKNYFGESVEHSTRLTIMQNTLKSGIFSEMKWATANGIISIEDGGKSFSNVKLDKGLFGRMYEQYLVSSGQDGTVSSANTAAVLNLMSANYINTAISIIEFEKLITKDPAFYKDPDAKMKRHSSMLSTGTNIRSDFPAGHELHGKTTYTTAELMDNEIPSVEIESIRKNMIVSQINELFRQNGKPVIPNLIDIYGTEEYDALKNDNKAVFTAAEKIVEKSIEGYDNNGINETDATAFVSPEMYRSILIRKGKWNPELDEAFELLMSDDASWMADDEKYLKVMQIATNPLKMIYYGDSFKGNLNVPKLNKMALFCLMKPIATGDLSVLYDRMNNPKSGLGKLDMVIFSSAVKVGNHNAISFYNEDGSIANMDNLSPDTQYFEYLRDQLVTDPHHESNIDLATQVQKISMSNVDRSRTYGNITIDGSRGATGDRILSDYRDSIVELSNRGVNKILKKLGIKSNPDGTIGEVDKKKLYKFLSEEAVKSGMPSDVVEMLSNYDPSGDMTIQGMFDDKWIEGKIVSDVLKKTIDVETPGGMFIQMTPFGLAKTSSDVGDIGYKLNDGKRLRFANEDGSMDAIISMSLFKDVLPEEIKKKSPIAQRNWLISNGIIGRDSNPIAIGYRIPTQGMPSVSYLKVVDVMPVNIGDTIMLPTEFTKLTGSDFDVDKLYIARYNIKNSKNGARILEFKDDSNSTVEDRLKDASIRETLNEARDIATEYGIEVASDEFLQVLSSSIGNSILLGRIRALREKWIEEHRDEFLSRSIIAQNSEKAIQNRIIDCMAAIISDPDSFMEARMPLDTVTDKLKNEILKHIDSFSTAVKTNSPFKFVSPSYHTDKKVEYSTGKRNLGPFALAITHHILTQIADLRFLPSKVLSKHGISDVSSVMGRDGVKILDWLSAMVSAHVDIAKDPYIIRLGINNYTIKMAAFMLRSGLGANTFYFLSQPAMKKYCDALDASAGKYQIAETDKNDREVLESIIREYKSELSNYADSDLKKRLVEGLENVDKKGRKDIDTNRTLDMDRLVSGLGNNNKDDFFRIYNQILVLETYSELSPYANELAEAVKYSQVDTKKGGSTFSEQSEFLRGVNRLIGDNSGSGAIFENIRSLFDDTFIYAKLLNSAGLIGKIGKGLLFRTSDSISNTIGSIMNSIGRRDMDNSKLIKSVSNYINSILKSGFFVKYAEDNNINISDLFFGENTLAKELYNIKSGIKSGIYKDLEKNEFISNITYNISNNRSLPDHISVINSNGASDVNISEKIRNYFDEMLNSDNKEIALFAKKFIVYQFFSTGDNSSINTIKLSEYTRESLGIHKYIKEKLDLVNSESFSLTESEISEMFENRWMDNDLVPVKENSRLSGNFFFNEITQRVEDEIILFPTIQSKKTISKTASNKSNSSSYPLAFVDQKPTISSASASLENASLFIPYIKKLIQYKNGESSYVLYKLAGHVTDQKTNAILPVYIAINKKGSKDSGLSIIEHGLGSESIVKNNILPETITISDIMAMKDNPIVSKYGRITEVDPISEIVNDINGYNIDDIRIGRSELDRAVDEAVANGDYSVTNLRDITSSMTEDEANEVYSNYAKAILRRSDELLRNSDEYLQADDESVIEGLKMRLEDYLQQFIQDEPIITEDTMVSKANIPQNLVSGVMSFGTLQEATDEIKAALGENPHSIDMIDAGFRTRTTRSATEMDKYNVKVGDIVTQFGKSSDGTTKSIKTRITAIHKKGTPGFTGTWEKEGWTQAGISAIERYKDGAAAIEFEVINDTDTIVNDDVASNKDSASQVTTVEREYTPENITSLPENGVFVFGSNTEGRHGMGAAKTAKDYFGAKYGQAKGPQGRSYAIVTKNLTPGAVLDGITFNKAGERSVDLNYIGEQLADLFEYASNNPQKKFYVVKLGSTLAGHAVDEIKSQIQDLVEMNGISSIPDNVILPYEYEVRESAPVVNSNSEPANTIEEYTEHGTKYRFELSKDNSIVKAEYKQGNKEWQPLRNSIKVYKRVSSSAAATPTVANNPASVDDSNNVQFAGATINLSKIGIPFKLNDGQSDAIRAISEWVTSDNMSPYAFKGYAGTGKTSVTKIIVAGLLASRTPFKLASFTHGAKRILSRMTGSPAKTIHSLLKMSVNDSSMSVGSKLEFGGARMDNIPYGGVIIIDESSMISDQLVDFIVETAAMKHTKVLFIGDKGQIDPPDNRGTNGMTIPSKALDYSDSSELTEVMRISNGSKLIDSVTSLRNAQNMSLVPQHGEAKLSMYTRRNEYNEIGGALWLGEPARMDMINMMIEEYFLSDAYAADNNFVKFIGWRNSVIDSINELVRRRLGMTGVIAAGETVIGQVKVTSSKDNMPMVENGDEYRVTKVGDPYTESVSFLGGIELEFVDVDIEMVNGESTGGSFKLLNDYSDASIEKIQNAILKKKAAISELYRVNRDLGAKESSKFYKDLNSGFITLRNIPNPNNISEKDSDSLKQKAIRHYHAITAHKSQGGEFTNVFVDDSDIRRAARNTDELSYKKLIYTAVSRAKEKAVIVTNGIRFDKAENKFVNQDEQNTIPAEFRNNSALNDETKTEDRPSDKC